MNKDSPTNKVSEKQRDNTIITIFKAVLSSDYLYGVRSATLTVLNVNQRYSELRVNVQGKQAMPSKGLSIQERLREKGLPSKELGK